MMYDYGLLGNLIHYKQTKPPHYDLSKVNSPVYIFYGSTDRLVTPKVILTAIVSSFINRSRTSRFSFLPNVFLFI